MTWNNISSYLEKFRNIKPPNDSIKKVVIDVISIELGVDLLTENLNVKNNIVYINSSPTLKNEVLFNKKELLGLVNKKLIGKSVFDIR